MEPLHRNVKRFRGGLVFKSHRLVFHSTLGWRVLKKKKKVEQGGAEGGEGGEIIRKKKTQGRGGGGVDQNGEKKERTILGDLIRKGGQ